MCCKKDIIILIKNIMKILITGSSGFLGSALSKQLSKLGHNVIPYDISDGKDICDANQFYNTLKESGATTVIHLAAIADLYLFHNKPELSNKINIEGTSNILKTCQELNVRLLFASTCCSYGNCKEHPSTEESPLAPTEDYANSKMISEQEITSVGLPHCSMRLATFYGPGMRKALAVGLFMDLMHNNKKVYIDGDGEQTRTWTYIDDIVNGIVTIALTPPQYKVVNITSEEEVSVNDIVTGLETLMNKKAYTESRKDRSYQIMREQISNKRLRSLGWDQSYNFEEGLKNTYEWYLRNGEKFER